MSAAVPALWLSAQSCSARSGAACTPKTRAAALAPPGAPTRLPTAYPGHIWACAVLQDALADGTPIYMLTVMDEFTREGLALEVWQTTSAEQVLAVLGCLFADHGAPGHLRNDNGSEFVARAVHDWLAQHHVETLDIAPGKPWQNGKEERFNGTVRDEGLNLYQSHSRAEARVRLSAFRHQYNGERPNSRLGYMPPLAFKTAWVAVQAETQDPNIGT